MFDHLPPDLPRLRTLETWLTLTPDEVRKAIAAKEQQTAEDAARRTPPPPPAWVIEMSLTGTPQTIHVGCCRMGGTAGRTKPLDRGQALRALGEGVESCQFCRPDVDLGWLE